MHKLIDIEVIHAGQPRPYTDSVYEAYISCLDSGSLMNNAKFYYELDEAAVKQLTKLFVRDFPDQPTHAFSPYLDVCLPVGPTALMRERAHPKWQPGPNSCWHVRVILPFTD